MSIYTNSTDLNEEFDASMFENYYDEIFSQFPLLIGAEPLEKVTISDSDIVQMKLKWVIEYFTRKISFKRNVKKMIDPILELASQVKNRDKTFKNLGHLRIMLKHC